MSVQRNNGFTLIELLITLVILSVGIVGVLRAFESSLFALGYARDQLWADLLIKEKTAEIDTVFSDNRPLAEMPMTGQFEGMYSDFNWDLELADIVPKNEEGQGTNKLSRIKLTVWRKGVDRQYTASTFRRQKL